MEFARFTELIFFENGAGQGRKNTALLINKISTGKLTTRTFNGHTIVTEHVITHENTDSIFEWEYDTIIRYSRIRTQPYTVELLR